MQNATSNYNFNSTTCHSSHKICSISWAGDNVSVTTGYHAICLFINSKATNENIHFQSISKIRKPALYYKPIASVNLPFSHRFREISLWICNASSFVSGTIFFPPIKRVVLKQRKVWVSMPGFLGKSFGFNWALIREAINNFVDKQPNEKGNMIINRPEQYARCR